MFGRFCNPRWPFDRLMAHGWEEGKESESCGDAGDVKEYEMKCVRWLKTADIFAREQQKKVKIHDISYMFAKCFPE